MITIFLQMKGETTEGPDIEELVNRETVDILPYVGWVNPDNMDDKVCVQSIHCKNSFMKELEFGDVSMFLIVKMWLWVFTFNKVKCHCDSREYA